jgi:YjbE family integral membrane protein
MIVTVAEISALLQVLMVDLVLAGDNALVVGMVAASVAREDRAKAIMIGIVAATLMRVIFAVITAQLLQIIGLTLAGGLLLLWVCWKLWREIRQQRREAVAAHSTGCAVPRPAKSFRQAVGHIVLADISMSLDNVLAVAGVAREHTWVLVVGLVLSVAFMGAAASLIARLLHRLYWLSYVGLGIILFVACHMIFDGTADVWGIASSNW